MQPDPATATPKGDPLMTPKEWLVTLVCAVVLVAAIPTLWRMAWPLQVEPDHRVPFAQSADHWHFARHSEHAAAHADALLLGDSVIWGAYARSDESLSHYLAERTGLRCANLGFNGAHPAALYGMVAHHGDAIRDTTVLLHCNLLWLSSARHDLSDDKEHAFNHPELIAQFDPEIRVYQADGTTRLGRALEQQSELAAFRRHLQQAHFGQRDIPSWTLANPYRWRGEAGPTDTADDEPAETPLSWTERGIAVQDFDWRSLADSVQWRYFRALVALLLERGNRVVVLVGPFNEHLLTPTSQRAYAALRSEVVSWLTEQGVEVLAPGALPSATYADASHPLAEGYRQLAEAIEWPR